MNTKQKQPKQCRDCSCTRFQIIDDRFCCYSCGTVHLPRSVKVPAKEVT